MHNSVWTATIAAISTPPGKGGVALIRISGEEAFAVAERVFSPKSGRRLTEEKARMQIYGDILADGQAVDDGLATRFPAPHSYTGEDTVEITCHGGMLITRTVLGAVLAAGAHPAPAGEFTRRAFLNGKLSLSAAEAVGRLLEAKSHAQIRLATTGATHRLTLALARIRSELIALMSALFARIDYPDEDLGELTDDQCLARIEACLVSLEELAKTYRTGRAVNEGIATVIAGKPNVGKSTLYNLLLGEEAAIVTCIPGTTRDVLERTVPLGDVLVHLSDTAGVHPTEDPVERIGVDRSLQRIRGAELILTVLDASRPLDGEDHALFAALKEASAVKIALWNKSDLASHPADALPAGLFDHVLPFCAKEGTPAPLADLVNTLFTEQQLITDDRAVVSSARQHAALRCALDSLHRAKEAFAMGFPADAASSDIERAIAHLSEVEGISVTDEIVADIFSKFCVGK